MSFQQGTRDFLKYLQMNAPVRDLRLGEIKPIRAHIAARPDKAMFYAGSFLKPVWKELRDLKKLNGDVADFDLLPDVLEWLPPPANAAPGASSLLAHIEALEAATPWRPDGFTIWRALSGIYASNAVGRVRFYVGSGVTRQEKVLAATEIGVLRRNPNIDRVSMDVIDWLNECVRRGRADMNFALT